LSTEAEAAAPAASTASNPLIGNPAGQRTRAGKGGKATRRRGDRRRIEAAPRRGAPGEGWNGGGERIDSGFGFDRVEGKRKRKRKPSQAKPRRREGSSPGCGWASSCVRAWCDGG